MHPQVFAAALVLALLGCSTSAVAEPLDAVTYWRNYAGRVLVHQTDEAKRAVNDLEPPGADGVPGAVEAAVAQALADAGEAQRQAEEQLPELPGDPGGPDPLEAALQAAEDAQAEANRTLAQAGPTADKARAIAQHWADYVVRVYEHQT